ncbi:MAG TPA: sulfotransferase, partial [Chitinophagaceae bacterium]
NLFIIGAPKCGTTSMAYYLSQHPEIFVSPYKEPHYFNLDSEYRYTFSEKQYLENFKNASNSHKYLMEASVWYLYSRIAADEILKYNSESKFIVMLRNPVDMFYSLHQQLLFSGLENVDSPQKAWNLQNERKKGLYIPYPCREKSLLQYRDTCSLGEQVSRLLMKVPKEKVHFILLDDLKDNPVETYHKALNFLEVKTITLPTFEIINEKKEKRFPWLSNVFSFFNRIRRKLGITKGFGLANFLARKNKRRASEKYKDEYLSMKSMLFKTFKEDIELLERVTNMNLEKWKNEYECYDEAERKIV